ncbi:MAG: hypothetical protein Q9163_003927, partial [Psora crenata]
MYKSSPSPPSRQENDKMTLSPKQWGWMAPPPGAEQLGKGAYAGVTVQDIINSSLDAYIAAGYNYTPEIARERAGSAWRDGWANPGVMGAAWEGTFTIP